MNAVLLLILFLMLFLVFGNYIKKANEPFQDIISYSESFFRITKRKENKTLQFIPEQNKLSFGNKNLDYLDLWTFWDKQLFNLNYGIYLTFNKETKTLGFSKERPQKNAWILNDKGRLLFIDSNKKEYCVPLNTLNENAMEKKCVDYGYYFEIIKDPIKLKQGEVLLVEERLEFPEKTTKNWKKNPPANKKFGNTNIKIYGNKDSYKFNITKNDSNEISLNIDILKPTILWIFIITTLSDNKDANKQQNKKENKKNKNEKKTSVEKNQEKISNKTNFNIEYHKMYPRMVKKLTSKTAIEFGVQDPRTEKIYRCRDILTSPYYIKKFRCLF